MKTDNSFLGYKGDKFKSVDPIGGFVYAPYIPLITTTTIVSQHGFTVNSPGQVNCDELSESVEKFNENNYIGNPKRFIVGGDILEIGDNIAYDSVTEKNVVTGTHYYFPEYLRDLVYFMIDKQNEIVEHEYNLDKPIVIESLHKYVYLETKSQTRFDKEITETKI